MLKVAAGAVMIVSGVTALSQAPPKSAGGVVSGVVVSADNHEVLGRSRVDLKSAAGGIVATYFTDRTGEFRFAGVAPGSYTLVAAKTGYATAAYRARRSFDAGTTIRVDTRTGAEGLTVALLRAGAITGRVLSEFGDPIAQHSVGVLRAAWVAGQRRFVPASRIAETDDRGEYRLGGLGPGSYIVCLWRGTLLPSAEPPVRTGNHQYFPDALGAAQAALLTVEPGQEIRNIDFVVRPGPIVPSLIAGTVVDLEGRPASGSISAVSVDGGGSVTMALSEGRFTRSLEPGRYVLTAQHLRLPELVAAVPFSLGERQQETLRVELRPGGRLTGRVALDAAGSVNFSLMQVNAFLPGGDSGPTLVGQRPGPVAPTGMFSIGGLAGPRLVRIEGIPSGWAVKAIMHAGRDVSETPIVFDEGVVADVQIVLTRALGHVAGGIKPPSGADYAVIVVPEDLTRLADFARFARLVRADQNGRYEVRDLLPGPYVAVAVEDADESEWSNPDYVRRVRGTGTPVVVSANQTTTLTLELQQP